MWRIRGRHVFHKRKGGCHIRTIPDENGLTIWHLISRFRNVTKLTAAVVSDSPSRSEHPPGSFPSSRSQGSWKSEVRFTDKLQLTLLIVILSYVVDSVSERSFLTGRRTYPSRGSSLNSGEVRRTEVLSAEVSESSSSNGQKIVAYHCPTH